MFGGGKEGEGKVVEDTFNRCLGGYGNEGRRDSDFLTSAVKKTKYRPEGTSVNRGGGEEIFTV